MPGKKDVLVDLTYWKFMRYFSCRLYSSPAVTVPYIDNEPVLQFAPGSDERAAVEKVGSCIELGIIETNINTRNSPFEMLFLGSARSS